MSSYTQSLFYHQVSVLLYEVQFKAEVVLACGLSEFKNLDPLIPLCSAGFKYHHTRQFFQTPVYVFSFEAFFVQITLDGPVQVGLRGFKVLPLVLNASKHGLMVYAVQIRSKYEIAYAFGNRLKLRVSALSVL